MQDPIGPIKAVCIHPSAPDEALDETFDLMTYARTRDESLPRPRDGQKLTWFHLEPLSPMFVAEVIDARYETEKRKFIAAFMAACVCVEYPDGQLKPQKRVPLNGTMWQACTASDEFLPTVLGRSGLTRVYEMGKLALDRAKLPPGAKGPFSLSGI